MMVNDGNRRSTTLLITLVFVVIFMMSLSSRRRATEIYLSTFKSPEVSAEDQSTNNE
jgi:hypothetical protein